MIYHEAVNDVTIPAEWVNHWKRQMTTFYKDLPEEEKESDRNEAEKMIDVMRKNAMSGHTDDCTIYTSIVGTDNIWAGLCNCGYGALCQRQGDFSHAISDERLESIKWVQYVDFVLNQCLKTE